MSITIVETSFDQLIQGITAPARSRSNTNRSSGEEQHGTQQGVVLDAKQDSPQADSVRRTSATSSLSRPTTSSAAASSWRSRSRSGSVASSASSGKLAITSMLRHGLPRASSGINPASVSEEQPQQRGGAGANLGDRPFPMARRVAGAQKTASCVLSADAQVMASVQGVTPEGLPVWWCHFDNMVVFDGMLKDGDSGDWIPVTRSSKGLPVSNKFGDEESVLLDLQCEHCKTVLGLHKWRYSTRVCRRSVCAGCKVRCRQEYFRMMKQGHCFNHFEKVASGDGPTGVVLERIPDAEIVGNVLAPVGSVALGGEPREGQRKIERSATPVAHLTDGANADLAAASEQSSKTPRIETLALEDLQTDLPLQSSRSRRTSSISALYFADDNTESLADIQKNPATAAAASTLDLSPAHSTEDIGLAITIDRAYPATPLSPPVTVQHPTTPRPVTQPCGENERPRSSRLPTPVIAEDQIRSRPLAQRRGTATSLTIQLPGACEQNQNEQLADSPQSEHPETPTFEMCEPGPIIEDIISPKFGDGRYDEEEFDISMMIRNLDTDEVTTLPGVH